METCPIIVSRKENASDLLIFETKPVLFHVIHSCLQLTLLFDSYLMHRSLVVKIFVLLYFFINLVAVFSKRFRSYVKIKDSLFFIILKNFYIFFNLFYYIPILVFSCLKHKIREEITDPFWCINLIALTLRLYTPIYSYVVLIIPFFYLFVFSFFVFGFDEFVFSFSMQQFNFTLLFICLYEVFMNIYKFYVSSIDILERLYLPLKTTLNRMVPLKLLNMIVNLDKANVKQLSKEEEDYFLDFQLDKYSAHAITINKTPALFADIANFTKFCSDKKATRVLEYLKDVMVSFDNLVHSTNVTKVRTIGDGYLVIGNVMEEFEEFDDYSVSKHLNRGYSSDDDRIITSQLNNFLQSSDLTNYVNVDNEFNERLNKIYTDLDLAKVGKNKSSPKVSVLLMCQLAFDMLSVVDLLNKRREDKVAIRIGISYGAVRVGFLGESQLEFDAWGLPVNEATDIQSFGIPGDRNKSIVVTHEIVELVGEYFCFVPFETTNSILFFMKEKKQQNQSLLNIPSMTDLLSNPSNFDTLDDIDGLKDGSLVMIHGKDEIRVTKGNKDMFEVSEEKEKDEAFLSSGEKNLLSRAISRVEISELVEEIKIEKDNENDNDNENFELEVEELDHDLSLSNGFESQISNSKLESIFDNFHSLLHATLYYPELIHKSHRIRLIKKVYPTIMYCYISLKLTNIFFYILLMSSKYSHFSFSSKAAFVVMILVHICSIIFSVINIQLFSTGHYSFGNSRFYLIVNLIFNGVIVFFVHTFIMFPENKYYVLSVPVTPHFIGIPNWTQFFFQVLVFVTLYSSSVGEIRILVPNTYLVLTFWGILQSTFVDFFGLYTAPSLIASALIVYVQCFSMAQYCQQFEKHLSKVLYFSALSQLSMPSFILQRYLIKPLKCNTLCLFHKDAIVCYMKFHISIMEKTCFENIMCFPDLIHAASGGISKLDDFLNQKQFEMLCDLADRITQILNKYDEINKVRWCGTALLIVTNLQSFKERKATTDKVESEFFKLLFNWNQISQLFNAIQEIIMEVGETNSSQYNTLFELRCTVGIAQSDLISGIVGSERIFYDIFGDAVNTAARIALHNSTISQEIHVTENVCKFYQENTNNLQLFFKKLELFPIFDVQTVERGNFTLQKAIRILQNKGIPASHLNLQYDEPTSDESKKHKFFFTFNQSLSLFAKGKGNLLIKKAEAYTYNPKKNLSIGFKAMTTSSEDFLLTKVFSKSPIRPKSPVNNKSPIRHKSPIRTRNI
eukprot:TRINITY_DN1850_c0_g1_i1.p1 TRINITY_DN1850_c0_g1~~TRINITY_DN1850_c0_g1_i1.p1  ORF type:complete len:1242 (+),score=262.83 TRINITY_DN1850_c0_g1_i1:217-3942(+)